MSRTSYLLRSRFVDLDKTYDGAINRRLLRVNGKSVSTLAAARPAIADREGFPSRSRAFDGF